MFRPLLRKAAQTTLIIGLFLGSAGCDVDPLDEGSIAVTLQSMDLLISAGQPGSYTITASNLSGNRVEWGEGSSSCQLSLTVVTPQGAETVVDQRACTEDFVSQGLDPGETRTEVIEWGGTSLSGGAVVLLPAGEYRLLGMAGDKGESEPLAVEVVVVP